MISARVLVIEDDHILARDIQRQLTRIGHTVVWSTSRGDDTLLLTLRTQPDLVLMDIRLEGDTDGVDAACRIRDECHVPVVSLTAYADDETERRASQAGSFGYILKPFEESQLRTIVKMALNKRRAERKLRESERRFVATPSSIGDAVVATDGEGRITFMNSVAESLTGWKYEEGEGRPLGQIFSILSEETREAVEDPAAKALRLGAIVGLANHTILRSRDGRELPIDDSASPIVDERGRVVGTVLVFRDMTERREAEGALRKAQADLAHMGRLTTMGELTVSIAHELNQPLMAIVSNAAACLGWLGQGDDNANLYEVRKAVNHIIRHGHRAGDVINSIRGLRRRTSPRPTQLDIIQVIFDILDLLRPELRGQNISVDIDLLDDIEPVLGDRNQLRQVILNLIKNGIEAMDELLQQPRALLVSSRFDESGNVEIAIVDTGVGLQSVNMERIFEAFYTTKTEGVGLGLSICRSIVEAHGARLWVSPNLPRGSIFRFTLPTAKRRAS